MKELFEIPFLFQGYPSWYKGAGVVWICLTAFLVISRFFMTPKIKADDDTGKNVQSIYNIQNYNQSGGVTTFNQSGCIAAENYNQITINKELPRSVTAQQQKTLKAALGPIAGERVKLTVPMGDQEALSFAHQLEAILKDAGLVTTGVGQAVYKSPKIGLFILNPSSDPSKDLPKKSRLMVETLRSIDLPVEGAFDPNQNINEISLIIGAK